MDDQARAIGRRVRYWRLRRNLDRQRFADMVGRSTSWLDKIESGERNLLRLPMLNRVAEALGVDPAALTDSPTARRVAQCVDAAEVQTIREALSWYPSVSVSLAHGLLRAMLNNTNGELGRSVQQMASRAGVTP